ncbi:hypothetical protein D9M68_714930 [compost metagenome]
MSLCRVAVPCQTAPLKCGLKSASRSSQTRASRRNTCNSIAWVSAQKMAMCSRTAASSVALSGQSPRDDKPSCLPAWRLAVAYSSPSSTTRRAATAAISAVGPVRSTCIGAFCLLARAHAAKDSFGIPASRVGPPRIT